MSHSHIVVQHLLKQMETWQPGQKKRDARPTWLTGLIEDMAEQFEPLTGVARVGFDCRMEDDTWVVRMYLGSTELVGGPEDGRAVPMSFELNLQQLISKFDRVEEFFWSVFPAQAQDIEEFQAYVTVGGEIQSNLVRFHFFATAPDDVGPGIRVHQDGRFETP